MFLWRKTYVRRISQTSSLLRACRAFCIDRHSCAGIFERICCKKVEKHQNHMDHRSSLRNRTFPSHDQALGNRV